MKRLGALWNQLWGDFDDEVSLTLTRDKVIASVKTTPKRFVFYLAVGIAIAFGVFAVCDRGEVFAPTRDPTPTPYFGWLEGDRVGDSRFHLL